MAITEEGFGFGIIGRVKRTIEARAKNVKKSVYDTRDTVVKGKQVTPGGIVTAHIQGAREANRELVPGLKEL